MSDHWRELAERIDIIEDEPELVDIQLDHCLLAMARYLVEKDRREQEHGSEQFRCHRNRLSGCGRNALDRFDISEHMC